MSKFALVSDATLLAMGLPGRVHKHQVLTTKAMTVSLQAPKGGFAIQRLSRETQWVDGSQQQKLGLLSLPEYARWAWIVTPLRRGTHPLHIVAAAKSCDENGVEAETLMPQEVIEVLVNVNYGRAASQLGQWLIVGAAGGLVAEYAPRLLRLMD